MQRPGKRLEQRLVAPGLLHQDGLVGEAALIQVFAHGLQQVDVNNLEMTVLLSQKPL
ncbi:hypothetical protein D9M71_599920 [compost metagenome]